MSSFYFSSLFVNPVTVLKLGVRYGHPILDVHLATFPPLFEEATARATGRLDPSYKKKKRNNLILRRQ